MDLIVRARDLDTGDLVDTVLIGGATDAITYHVLLKLDINVDGGTADDVTYWVNPDDLSSETAANTSAGATGTFQSAAMDQNDRIDRLNVLTNNWTNRSFFWDETRLGIGLRIRSGRWIPRSTLPTSMVMALSMDWILESCWAISTRTRILARASSTAQTPSMDWTSASCWGHGTRRRA